MVTPRINKHKPIIKSKESNKMPNLKPLIAISNSQLAKYCLEFNCKTAEGIDLGHLKIWLHTLEQENEVKDDKD